MGNLYNIETMLNVMESRDVRTWTVLLLIVFNIEKLILNFKFYTFDQWKNATFLSSETVYQRCSIKQMFLKVLQKFAGTHLCWNLYLIKWQTWKFTKKETPAQMFPGKLWHTFWEHQFERTPPSYCFCILLKGKWKLTHFSLVSHFHTPWIHQKTKGFQGV